MKITKDQLDILNSLSVTRLKVVNCSVIELLQKMQQFN